MTRGSKVLAAGALFAAGSTLVAGCGFSGVYDMPLPGGADLGSHPITVHARLANVYDLVPHEAVKVNFVAVGNVTGIELAYTPSGKWMADVAMEINGGTDLPANTTAEIRQTSLLGEKYVQLAAPPPGQAHGKLTDGARVREDDSFHHAEIEEILGALSLLLNNGGLAQVKTISQELEKATSGNEQAIRSTLASTEHLVRHLDEHRGAITTALDGLNRLSATLDNQKEKLANVIDHIGPGLRALNQQRDQLVTMLQALHHLSGVTIDTINKSQRDLVADLKLLRPTLTQLAASGKNLPDALQLLLTPPFTDYAARTFRGDYDNLYATVDLNLGDVIDNLSRSRQNPLGPLRDVSGLGGITGGTTSASPSLSRPAPLPLPQSDTPQPDAGAGNGVSGLAGLLRALTGGGA